MFCHLFSILRLRGGGSTGTTAQGLHMSKSGPGTVWRYVCILQLLQTLLQTSNVNSNVKQ